jgi:hypothetical protein
MFFIFGGISAQINSKLVISFQIKMMVKVIVVIFGLAIVCHGVEKTATESHESHESQEDDKSDHLGMEGDLCMPHCAYVCMHNNGKAENCLNLLNHSNNTLSSLPTMATCPSNMSLMNDCFLKCGCQCTRCAVCFLKSFNVSTVTAACKASSNLMDCIHEKKVAALKACN